MENELEMLSKNLTKEYAANSDYETEADLQRKDSRVVAIPEIEWKNSILQGYFLAYLFNLGLEFFPEYEKAKESALKAYEMTFNIANRTKDKLEKKSEEKSQIIQ